MLKNISEKYIRNITTKKLTLTFPSLLDLARNSAAERASITFQFFVRNSCGRKIEK